MVIEIKELIQMPKIKNPFKYPLRSRAAIVKYLIETGFDYQGILLSFNVKVHNVNFEFDNMLKLHSENETLNQTQIEYARQWFTTRYGENKWVADKTQEAQRNQLWEWAMESAQTDVEEGDAYTTLWDDTPIDAPIEWRGRSGGYVVMPKFEGWDLVGSEDTLEEFLMQVDYEGQYEFPYKTLVILYKYMVEMNEFLNSKTAEKNVEYAASYTIFGNLLRDELEAYSDDKLLIHA
jgi:hypothetical protein